jgi:hypothetical protein
MPGTEGKQKSGVPFETPLFASFVYAATFSVAGVGAMLIFGIASPTFTSGLIFDLRGLLGATVGVGVPANGSIRSGFCASGVTAGLSAIAADVASTFAAFGGVTACSKPCLLVMVCAPVFLLVRMLRPKLTGLPCANASVAANRKTLCHTSRTSVLNHLRPTSSFTLPAIFNAVLMLCSRFVPRPRNNALSMVAVSIFPSLSLPIGNIYSSSPYLMTAVCLLSSTIPGKFTSKVAGKTSGVASGVGVGVGAVGMDVPLAFSAFVFVSFITDLRTLFWGDLPERLCLAEELRATP